MLPPHPEPKTSRHGRDQWHEAARAGFGTNVINCGCLRPMGVSDKLQLGLKIRRDQSEIWKEHIYRGQALVPLCPSERRQSGQGEQAHLHFSVVCHLLSINLRQSAISILTFCWNIEWEGRSGESYKKNKTKRGNWLGLLFLPHRLYTSQDVVDTCTLWRPTQINNTAVVA